MKRTLLVVLLLVALGAGVFIYINQKMDFTGGLPDLTRQETSPKAVKPELVSAKKIALSPLTSLFPSGPMMWIHLKDLRKLVVQIKKSIFYKQAVEYKLIDPSKSLPMSINIETTAKNKGFMSKFSSELEEKALMDFLGQEIGLAFYPSKEKGAGNFLFVTKISTITKIQEKLNRFKASFLGEKGTVTKENYNEKIIITYKNKEQNYLFHYIIIKNFFLASSSDILLKKGMDLMEKKGASSFVQSEEFNSLFKNSDFSLSGLFFIDIEEITPYIFNNVFPTQKVPSIVKENTEKQLQSFKYLGLTFKIKKGIEINSILTINQKKAGKELIQAIDIEPREQKSLSFMPDNTVIYGSSLYDPGYFFEQFGKGLETKPKQKKSFEKNLNEFFRKFTDITLKDDIIPFLGNEFFYSASGQDKSLPLRIPNITVGVEIKNRKKIEALLKKIEAKLAESLQQKTFQKEFYKGYNIHFLPLPMGIQPGYSIIGKFLLFSVNQTGIKQMINTLRGKTLPLQKNQKYIDLNIPVKNNGMVYFNASLLWESLTEAIKKTPASSLPTPSEEIIATGLKSLDLLHAVKSVSGTLMYNKNQISTNVIVLVEDLQKVKTDKELLAFLGKSSKQIALAPSTSIPIETPVSYAYTYDPVGKRDPFKSLITGKLLKTKRFVQFFEKIKSLQPINLYLYNRIKKKDSVLFKKLKDHARFFKNIETMENVSQEEKEKRLEDYSYLISIARTDFHDTILTPLQSAYASLKLVGTVRGKLGVKALIQTPDGKGYNIKVNDYVGPNYGKVEKIEKDKIVIVEKHVNYIDKIIEKRQEIKLPVEEE